MLTRRDLKDKELVQQAELNRLQMLQTVLNSTHRKKSKAAIKMLPPNMLEMILKESGLLSPAPPLYLCSPGRLPFAHAIISSSELLSPFIFRVYRDGRPIFQHQVPVRGEIDFFFDAEPDAVQRMFSVEYKPLHTIHVYYGSRPGAEDPPISRVGCCGATDSTVHSRRSCDGGIIEWELERQ